MALESALLHYALNNGGEFPTGLGELVARDENGAAYLDLPKVPEDPWGRRYFYAGPRDERPYSLFTLGADGLVGGVGADSDLTHETD